MNLLMNLYVSDLLEHSRAFVILRGTCRRSIGLVITSFTGERQTGRRASLCGLAMIHFTILSHHLGVGFLLQGSVRNDVPGRHVERLTPITL